jgi:hypothetical protein
MSQCRGGMSHSIMVERCCDSHPFPEILSSAGTHLSKYRKMAAILDGDLAPIQEFTIQLDNFKVIRRRLNGVRERCLELERLGPNVCKLCTTMQRTTVCHGGCGCPRAYLSCYKCCIGRHTSKQCTGVLFKVPAGFCWTCWMPLQTIFGYSFHSTHPSDIGQGCSNPAKDVLKQFTILFFHTRALAPMVNCTASSQAEFIHWLFNNSAASAAGEANIPNVLTLFDAAFEQV